MASTHQSLTLAQARQLALKAQNLWDRPPSRPNVDSIHALTRHLGAVQLDTISVLARSHELVAYARLGAMPKASVESGYWHRPGTDATHFEYWSHAASILPIESWPLFGFRRQAYRDRGLRWHEVDNKTLKKVKDQLRANGPMTTTDLGGGRKDAYWWNWSDVKVGVEFLLDIGEVAVTSRDKWRRVYDLTERVIPDELLYDEPAETGIEKLLRASLSTLGVGTKSDVFDVHRFKTTNKIAQAAWKSLIDSDEVLTVSVAGSDEIQYALAADLAGLDRTKARRSVLLSPFDSLVWHRPRLQRLFDMEYRIEAYTPEAKRYYGYFAMPVLAGDKIIARVDPGRERDTFIAKTIVFESLRPTEAEVTSVAAALSEAATWVGSTTIDVRNVVPKSAAAPLRQLAKGFAAK